MTVGAARYIIDTSAIADLYIRRYPRKIFDRLWRDIDQLAHDQRLLTVESVIAELKPSKKRKSNPITQVAAQARALHHWLSTQVATVESFSHQSRIDVARDGMHLANSHVGWSTRQDVADPYVIAAANLIGGSVITSETGTKNVTKMPNGFYPKSANIPSICRVRGVPCLGLVGFFDAEGWRY